MKNLNSMLCFAIVFFVGSVGESFALPPCPVNPGQRHHKCFGTYTFANGEKYVGEFRDDKYNGQGATTFANGNKYVGEYKDGKKKGQGTFTFEDGQTTKGMWKNNEFQYAQKGPPTVIAGKFLPPFQLMLRLNELNFKNTIGSVQENVNFYINVSTVIFR